MDAEGAIDVRAGSVRRSRVVRAPRCWRYVGGKRPADNGGKRAVHRGEHEVSRRAIAQGRPECCRCPVCSCAVLFAQIARETAGAASTRSSLRPLFSRRANEGANLGRSAPRDRETVSTSLRAQRSNPPRRTKRRSQALPGHGVDAPARRRLQHLMITRPEQRGQFRPYEAPAHHYQDDMEGAAVFNRKLWINLHHLYWWPRTPAPAQMVKTP